MGKHSNFIGTLSRPVNDVLYVPSKPYLLYEASLKEQVMYPDVICDEERLLEAVETTKLLNLFNQNPKLNESDQQKLMLCRMIYHEPRFVLLDDCVRNIDTEYLLSIIKYLQKKQVGIIIACSPTEGFRNRIRFDLEIVLKGNKHEIQLG